MQVTPGSNDKRSYKGGVAERCRAVANVTNGGQIICDIASLEGIRSHLAELYKGCIEAGAQRALVQLAECASHATCQCLVAELLGLHLGSAHSPRLCGVGEVSVQHGLQGMQPAGTCSSMQRL